MDITFSVYKVLLGGLEKIGYDGAMLSLVYGLGKRGQDGDIISIDFPISLTGG